MSAEAAHKQSHVVFWWGETFPEMTEGVNYFREGVGVITVGQ